MLVDRLAEGLPVLLARKGRSGGASHLEERGVLATETLDLVAGVGMVDLVGLAARQDLADADGCGGLRDLAVEAVLEAEELVDLGVGT
ncbi:hypothetical protein HC251_24155 [Iamia sp. SCSIO 61187]|uniref:hypothetical protein n=1 Tax=Iamia sp. SCSIO 61187 TaxID=2722752 RepID=UPI001C62613B|nr:hypothetical protein [Iamia sp. SCSIO 61187]QYG95216.1 hypothetical protein HC251_24155 [Iamia sp. SCSIO 61187]